LVIAMKKSECLVVERKPTYLLIEFSLKQAPLRVPLSPTNTAAHRLIWRDALSEAHGRTPLSKKTAG
jgi:hypothetical protein